MQHFLMWAHLQVDASWSDSYFLAVFLVGVCQFVMMCREKVVQSSDYMGKVIECSYKACTPMCNQGRDESRLRHMTGLVWSTDEDSAQATGKLVSFRKNREHPAPKHFNGSGITGQGASGLLHPSWRRPVRSATRMTVQYGMPLFGVGEEGKGREREGKTLMSPKRPVACFFQSTVPSAASSL